MKEAIKSGEGNFIALIVLNKNIMGNNCKHEQKNCPRCKAAFECRVGDITNCQCYGVELSVPEEAYIASHYNECLCRNCLVLLKNRYHLFTEQKEFYSQR